MDYLPEILCYIVLNPTGSCYHLNQLITSKNDLQAIVKGRERVLRVLKYTSLTQELKQCEHDLDAYEWIDVQQY